MPTRWASLEMDLWISELMSCWSGGRTARHFWLQEFYNGAKRNFQPRRAMSQFVTNFINRLFEQMNFEQHFQFVFGLRQQVGFSHDIEVCVKIDRADPTIPEAGPRFELRQPLFVECAQFKLLKKRRVSCVFERADHHG